MTRTGASNVRPSSPAGVIDVLWTDIGGATTVRLARSEDGGRTFGSSRSVQAPDAPGDRGWAALAADGSGRAHAMWLDHRGLAATGSGQGDRPHSPHQDHVPSAADEALHDISSAEGSSLYYAAGGERERALFEGVCYCCKTAMAIGFDGRLFLAWRHVYPRNMRDIAFTVSADGGRSFADPVRVSTDDWQINGCPDDGPALAVDGGGVVHLAWPTLVSEPGPHKAIFYAFSGDGRTFAPRRRVSAEGVSGSHPQIAVSDEGTVVVLWDEVAGGVRRVAASRISAGGDASILPVHAASEGVRASYPVGAFSGGALLAAWVEDGDTASRVIVRRIEIP